MNPLDNRFSDRPSDRTRVKSMLHKYCQSLWLTVAIQLLLVEAASAQRTGFTDYDVRPAQAGVPYGYGNPGVALQGIQPFDPYASAPGLPPPLSGGNYSSAYPAPAPNLSAPPFSPPVGNAPVVPPTNYSQGSNRSSLLGNGPYQPAFNFNGGGLYGGLQIPFLQPRYGNFVITSDAFGPSTTVNATPKHDLAFSTRLIAGFEGPEGLGVRARWWHFDDTASGVGSVVRLGDTIASTTSAQLETDVFDLELTQAGRFHNWEFLVSGGVRYADLGSKIESTFMLPPERFFRTTSGFNGVGPVLGVSTRRSLRQWEGLAFDFNSRFAFLFGDHEVQNTSDLSGAAERENLASIQDVLPTWELQIGAHWTRQLRTGATFYIGAFFEAQLWDWIAPGQINSDLGFWGPTFAVGISQ